MMRTGKMEIFNSKIAKVLLMKNYSAITLGVISFYKFSKQTYPKTALQHEAIHRAQYKEMFCASLPITLFLCFISLWFIILPIFSFYICYLVEYFRSRIVRFFRKDKSQQKSYNSISMEEEAYQNQKKANYICHRPAYNWVKYLGKF